MWNTKKIGKAYNTKSSLTFDSFYSWFFSYKIINIKFRSWSISTYNFAEGIQCHCESCQRRGIAQDKPVVHINVGGRAGRRGIGVTGENYVWRDGNPQPSLQHQRFELKVCRYAV